MMGLFWTPEAIKDREDIYDYIESDNPAAALALDELFQEKAARLLDHPLAWVGLDVNLARVSSWSMKITSWSMTRPPIW